MKHKTYIINLKERKERKKHILDEFAKYSEFEITIFDAIKRKSGSEGLFESIKQIVYNAYESKDKYVIVCEDDHVFTNEYNNEYLSSLIETGKDKAFDILLGGPSSIQDALFVNEKLVWLSGFSGTQFIVIFQNFYESILNYKLPPGADYDLELGQLSENIYCCYPPISEQTNFGYSDVTSKNNNIDLKAYFDICRTKLNQLYKVTQYFKSLTN
ncbi:MULTISPECIES: glycosyltransferase family 25 protein [Sphingobacterium]|uniref:glycosyltransferase family 25 protein n=1 Tax=Sphingobacterium TaxID=28453 RepID=UPI00129CEC70|nr:MULTISPECIES: glycosyltransferase family 25 protein [Sphingobacterium]